MKRIGRLSIYLVMLTALLAMCKKDFVSTMVPASDSSKEKPGYKKVKSRHFNLTTDQLKTAINGLKQYGSTHSKVTSDIYTRDSLSLDSAEFLLEASLNYDFDQPIDTLTELETADLTYTFALRVNTDYISGSVLNTIYEAAYSEIDELKTSDNKVAAIDVVTYVSDPSSGGGYFQLSVAIVHYAGYYPCLGSPFTPSSLYWYYQRSELPGAILSQCTGSPYTGVFGNKRMANSLNCFYFNPLICENYFFINVGDGSTAGYNGDNRLWWVDCHGALTYCSGISGLGSTFNSYYTNCQQYLQNYNTGGNVFVPGTAKITLDPNGHQCGGVNNYQIWWVLYFKQGERRCDRWD